MAVAVGPRFALVFLFYILTARPNSTLPKFVASIGFIRTITCGGWTYVTSTDHHMAHDVFMVAYLVATVPWTLGCLALSRNPRSIYWRKVFAGAFFGTLVPLTYYFIQHKVHKVAGGMNIAIGKVCVSQGHLADICIAYSIYALFEWSVIIYDVGFDAVTALDFEGFEVIVKDVKGVSRGYVHRLPR